MPDAIFCDPRLARIYDPLDPDRSDLDAYAAMAAAFGWVGSMAYLLITESALAAGWATPWIWPARPPHDRGAAICASLVFATGAAVITLRGGREPAVG